MSNLAVTGYNNSEAKSVIEVDAVNTKLAGWSEYDNHDHIPNAETISAMLEADEHLRRLEAGEIQPRFNNLAEFFLSLLSEEIKE